MKLKNNDLEKKEVLINRVRLETQLEELLENLLEEMNKQLIIYMPLMILCMLKIKELMEMLKQMMLFFVSQLLEIVLLIHNYSMPLNFNTFERHLPEFQFSVSGSGFSVLVPAPGKFNSLYRASGSLKNKK
jgi:hypothetical protein